MNKGLLIVVSAPSGCGKGTILAEILKDPQFYYSISATTRKPREGEVNGVNYHFLSREQFEGLIKNNGLLEHAEFCGNYYGTPRKQVEEKLNEGKNVILEIEVQGAMKIKETCPEAVFIFILPPSIKELRRRLNKRGTESEEVINQRVSQAIGEIKMAYSYDYIMINDELEKAIEDMKAIISVEKMTCKHAVKNINEVLENA